MDLYSFMEREFISSNYYDLSFTLTINENSHSAFVFSHNPNVDTLDGVFLYNDRIELYIDDELIETIYDVIPTGNMDIVRQGTVFTFFANGVQVYETEQISWNTVGAYDNSGGYAQISATNFVLKPYIVTEITPATADYDGTVFGSNIHLEIKDNQLGLIDYGMLPEGSIGGGKVILNDVPLQNANEYAIQLEMRYNNTRFERLNNLTGQMQMRVYEDISTSDSVKDYAKTLCSPMPVPNSKTVFTRHTDEGTLYFVKDPLDANSSFLSNAYNQYKGGVEITSETGVSLFNLDNAYSPVFVGNELVRAEFHRRSGFIRIARYDETSGDWVNVNTLKLKNYPQLVLNEYNDDYAEIAFGNTTWKFYRGRPFIIVNHSQDELRIMDLVDRVYCETIENQRGMGYITDYNPNDITIATDENGVVVGSYSTFNPQLSIQQFRQELHIGENIRLDNFELYEDEYSLKEKSTIFEDSCTSTSNKSSGYVQNTGSYSFDSNGLTIESEPTNVWFTDDGTSVSHNDNWNGLQYMTRTDTGTIINNTSGSALFDAVYINSSTLPFTNEDLVVEFEIVENPSSTNKFRFDGQTLCDGESYRQFDFSFAQNETGKFKFVYDSTNNTIAKYKNGAYVETITHHFCGKMGFLFRLENGTSIKYKNFRVFKNYQANLRLDDSKTYKVPFEVSFDLINDGNDNFRCYFHNTSFSNSAIASGSLWTNPSGQTTKIRFVVTHNGIKRYIGNNETSLSLSQNVADNMGVRFGYWQSTQSSIKIKNYKVTQLGYINDIGEVATDSQMGITQIDNDNALVIVKEDNPLALNFPSYSHYVERVNDTFTLLISYFDCPFENVTIKARGFDERGAVPVKDDVQYGIWEQSVNVTVDTTAPDSIRATFTNCPAEVKYIDFLIFFEGSNSTDIILKDIMYYEGDAVINYDVDTSRVYAEQVEVHFADTYFANLYNDKDSGGLCIARPYQEPFSLRSIYASSETVLIPYMKKCAQWDKPEQVFLEYLNANKQIIDIDWEN